MIPKIGMRNVKSAIAVFVCCLIYYFRNEGMVFYSAIAAILCMQQDVSNSLRVAADRTIGTLIGGFYGMLVLIAERSFIPPTADLLKYLLVSATIIPLIYITVLIKKPSITYITCVVCLSITISHAADLVPLHFAISRIIDTLIGIFVSLGINIIRLPKKK